MSTRTPKLGLVKPELSDPADITMMNANWDKIDELLGTVIPKITKVTIPSSSWNTNTLTQTITVNGILADDTLQLVQAVPSPSSMSVATESGAYCSGQSANALTFTCSTIPSEDIVFNVSYQNATYVG
jgi:hypothetical protein